MAAKGMPKKMLAVKASPVKAAPKPFQPRMRDPESGAPMRRGRPVATANVKPGPAQEPPLANPKKPGVSWAKQPMMTPRAEAATSTALRDMGKDLKTAGDFYKGKMGMGGGGKGGK